MNTVQTAAQTATQITTQTPALQLPGLNLHTRLAALALSLFCTVAVLQSMDHLATSEPTAPAVMAAASAAQA